MKFMFLLYRRSDISHGECIEMWRGSEHASIVKKVPGLVGWTQNAVDEPLRDSDAPDGVGELLFSDLTAFQAAMESPEMAAAFEDLERFGDSGRCYGFTVTETRTIA